MINVRLQVNEEKLQMLLQIILQSTVVYRTDTLLQLMYGFE